VLTFVERLEWLPIELKLGEKGRKEPPDEESNTEWIEKEAGIYGAGNGTHQ
jgi:hypothetical protein